MNRTSESFSPGLLWMGLCLAACLPLSAAMAAGDVRTAEQVFINGAVYTQDDAQPWAQGFAISDGKYFAVGSSAAMRELVGPETRVVDLKGRMVMSGLIDDHVHAVDGAIGELYDCLFGST